MEREEVTGDGRVAVVMHGGVEQRKTGRQRATGREKGEKPTGREGRERLREDGGRGS